MKEFPSLQKVHATFAPKGLVVIGISSDDVATINQIARQHRLTFRQLRDADDKVFDKYHGSGIPRTLIIDKKGIVRADIEGSMDFNEFRKELKKVGL